MIETKKTISEYKKVCHICQKEIKGYSREQVEYNFATHFFSCKKKAKMQKEKLK